MVYSFTRRFSIWNRCISVLGVPNPTQLNPPLQGVLQNIRQQPNPNWGSQGSSRSRGIDPVLHQYNGTSSWRWTSYIPVECVVAGCYWAKGCLQRGMPRMHPSQVPCPEVEGVGRWWDDEMMRWWDDEIIKWRWWRWRWLWWRWRWQWGWWRRWWWQGCIPSNPQDCCSNPLRTPLRFVLHPHSLLVGILNHPNSAGIPCLVDRLCMLSINLLLMVLPDHQQLKFWHLF